MCLFYLYIILVAWAYVKFSLTQEGNVFLAPQIEYSAFLTRFNKAYLLSLYKINGSDKN